MKLVERWKATAAELERETYAIYLAYRDPRVPWYARVWAALVVAYAFSPIDLIPDFIPILGYLDDLLLVPLGIALALKLIPADVLAECREKAQQRMDSGQPCNRGAAIAILLIWVLLAVLSILLIYRAIRQL